MSTPVGPSSLRRSGDAELLHFGEQRRASEAEARRRTACEVPLQCCERRGGLLTSDDREAA